MKFCANEYKSRVTDLTQKSDDEKIDPFTLLHIHKVGYRTLFYLLERILYSQPFSQCDIHSPFVVILLDVNLIQHKTSNKSRGNCLCLAFFTLFSSQQNDAILAFYNFLKMLDIWLVAPIRFETGTRFWVEIAQKI